MKRLALVLTGLAVSAAPMAQAAAKQAPARRAAPAKVDWTKTIAQTPEGGVRMGNPAAKVKLIEYGSRTCPTCAAFTVDGAPPLKVGFIASGQVSYEFRDFPVHGAVDLGPILLGHCGPLRTFFPVLEAMMANQRPLIGRDDQVPADKQEALKTMPPNAIADYLAGFYGYTDFLVKAGLPPARAKACLADAKGIDAIVAQSEAARTKYQVRSTPTFLINGAVADKVYDWSTLEPALRAAGAR